MRGGGGFSEDCALALHGSKVGDSPHGVPPLRAGAYFFRPLGDDDDDDDKEDDKER